MSTEMKLQARKQSRMVQLASTHPSMISTRWLNGTAVPRCGFVGFLFEHCSFSCVNLFRENLPSAPLDRESLSCTSVLLHDLHMERLGRKMAKSTPSEPSPVDVYRPRNFFDCPTFSSVYAGSWASNVEGSFAPPCCASPWPRVRCSESSSSLPAETVAGRRTPTGWSCPSCACSSDNGGDGSEMTIRAPFIVAASPLCRCRLSRLGAEVYDEQMGVESTISHGLDPRMPERHTALADLHQNLSASHSAMDSANGLTEFRISTMTDQESQHPYTWGGKRLRE